MQVCKKCNTDNLPDALFCENCGSKIETDQKEKIELEDVQYCEECGTKAYKIDVFCRNCGHSFKNHCPNCKSENQPDSKFCSSCGQSLIDEFIKTENKKIKDTSVNKKSLTKPQKVKKGKRKKLWLIPLFLIVIVGALLFIFNVKVVDSYKYVNCSVCNGSNVIESTKTCDICKGRGWLDCDYKVYSRWSDTSWECEDGYHDTSWGYFKCDNCNGKGWKDCYRCGGYGYVKTEKDCSNCDSDGEVKKYIKITLAREWGW